MERESYLIQSKETLSPKGYNQTLETFSPMRDSDISDKVAKTKGEKGMAKYIFKRILTAIPLIIVITILCFSLIHLAPYDAIDAMTTPKMSPEMVQMIREKYGYDQPVYVQYIRWLEGILNGNFGYSIVTKTSLI